MQTLTLRDAVLNSNLEQQVKSEFYYSSEWFDVLKRQYGYPVTLLTTTSTDGKLTGILPVCLIHSLLTGKHVVGLPFSDHCPLLATDEGSANKLIDQAIQFTQKEKAQYLELRTGSNTILANRPDLATGNLYARWYMPLTDDTEAIWSHLRKPVQRQIKKAQNAGVQVRSAQDRKDVMHYYHLHLRTRSKHGMPAQSQRFFLELWDELWERKKIQLLLAEYQGTPIAGMLLLMSDTTIRYAYGASAENYLHLGPNNLLMWHAIESGSKQGYQVLDMGRTAYDNEGLMEFKRRWGAIQEPLPYYYYPHMTGLASTSESSTKFRLLTTCWKRLPLPIASSLGGILYKHLG